MRWMFVVLWSCSEKGPNIENAADTSAPATENTDGNIDGNDQTETTGGLTIQGELTFDAPVSGLEYYYDAVDDYCSKSPTIDGEPGLPVNFLVQESWPDGARVQATLTYSNIGQTPLYVAGFSDYGADEWSSGAWALWEEFWARNPLPGVMIFPSSVWEDGPREPEATGGMVLLPGESATQSFHARIACSYASGEWLPANVGDQYDGIFLHAHGACLESVEEIQDYGLPCTPPIEPETADLPAAVRVIDG